MEPSREQTLSYIKDMAGQLAQMLQSQRLDFLAGILTTVSVRLEFLLNNDGK